jgi:hypothetical protein
MRKGFLGCALVSVAGASLALAQGPSPYQYIARDGAAVPADVAKQTSPVASDAKTGAVTTVPAGIVGGGCADNNCGNANGGNNGCGRDGRVWASIEYLAWWIKDAHAPPLATIGSPNDFVPGAIGQPGTVVAIGGDDINYDTFSGLRFTSGMWFNDCRTRGMETSYFFLSQESKNFTAVSSGGPGTPVIARPFLDANGLTPSAVIVAFPGIASGAVSVNTSSRMWGTDSNLLCNLICNGGNNCGSGCGGGSGLRVDGLVGFRYLELREGLGVAESSTVLATAPPLIGGTLGNTNILSFDQFDTYNRFYGGQVGLKTEWWRDRWVITSVAKVALGDNHQSFDVFGGTSLTPAGPLATPGAGATVVPGGLLTQTSNIGHFTRDRFSVVGESGINVGYQLTDAINVFVGYTFLYWTNVARPGDQISPVVNATRIPGSVIPPSGPTAPIFQAHDTDFWAQGVNFGVAVRF